MKEDRKKRNSTFEGKGTKVRNKKLERKRRGREVEREGRESIDEHDTFLIHPTSVYS
jgi:hypothetical protein